MLRDCYQQYPQELVCTQRHRTPKPTTISIRARHVRECTYTNERGRLLWKARTRVFPFKNDQAVNCNSSNLVTSCVLTKRFRFGQAVIVIIIVVSVKCEQWQRSFANNKEFLRVNKEFILWLQLTSSYLNVFKR